MPERWVSKLEATSLFKVTERTLDNWVKSEKIKKERRKGQIVYEISLVLEEKAANEAQYESFSNNSEANPSFNPPPVETDEEIINVEEQVANARLEEKNLQIATLLETLEKRQKDLNTLVMERGTLSEKSNMLLIEAATLRKETENFQKEREGFQKERETLQKEFIKVSERSFSRISVYFGYISLIVIVSAVIGVSIWSHNNELIRIKNETNLAEERAKKEEKRALSNEEHALKLQKDKDLLAEKVSEIKQKEALAVQKASEASERVSEMKKDKEILQKEIENLQKVYKEQQNEVQDLKLNLKIKEAVELNNSKSTNTKKEPEKPVKERAVEKPVEKAPEKPIEPPHETPTENNQNLPPKGSQD
jgi:chromosome segregation ATPase